MASLKKAGPVLIALVLALSLAAIPADGKKRKRKPVGTQVTLTHPSEQQFAGVVRSKRYTCHNQRLVNLFYTDPVTGQTQPLSVQRSDKSGNYRVDLPKPVYGGTYHAEVPKVSKRGSLLCRAGQSNAIAVVGAPLTP
jgi:hypothetical protein